jgi:20S proteasome subunit alpha 5
MDLSSFWSLHRQLACCPFDLFSRSWSDKGNLHSVTSLSVILHPHHARSHLQRAIVQSRPFGVALLVAGVDEGGPILFHADASGTFVEYQAKAIGSEGAQSLLQDKFSKDMSLKDAETLALQVLKQVRLLVF